MADHNRTGSIWSNVTSGANRRRGPGTTYNPPIDTLSAGTAVIVLCYAKGENVSWTAPNGHTYTSDAWDFVVTSDQDLGGYIADVFIDTGGDITQQLGAQGTCDQLGDRFDYS